MLERNQKILIGVLAAAAGALVGCSQSETPAKVSPLFVVGTPIIIADGGGNGTIPAGLKGVGGLHFRDRDGWTGATGSTGPFTATASGATAWAITDPDFTETLNATNTLSTSGKVVIGVSGGTFTITDTSGGCVLVTQNHIFCSGYALPPSIPLQGATGPTGVTEHSPSIDTNAADKSVSYYLIAPHK